MENSEPTMTQSIIYFIVAILDNDVTGSYHNCDMIVMDAIEPETRPHLCIQFNCPVWQNLHEN